LKIINSIFDGNNSTYGGSIYILSQNLELSGSIIKNSFASIGACLFSSNSNLKILNSDFYGCLSNLGKDTNSKGGGFYFLFFLLNKKLFEIINRNLCYNK
jgi:hypothetical protein